MKNWINYSDGLPYGTLTRSSDEMAEMMHDVFPILEACFDVNEIYGKMGTLLAKLQLQADGSELVDLPAGKVFLPGIHTRDKFLHEIQKAESELHELAQAIQMIEAEKFQSVEIQIKMNKGKRSAQTIRIEHDETLSLIMRHLKQLPKGKPMQKAGKGNPEKKAFKQFMQDAVKKCFDLIEPTNPDLTETEKLFFAGLVLTLAGVMPPPKYYNEGAEINMNLLQDYKDKLTDQLKYYKPKGK
jgi:hypothetical protein